MTIEQFLSYWNQHNTSIIEGLVGLIILLSLFLGYRSFFGKKSGDESGLGAGGVDAAQLEKTLQKILDNQGSQGKTSRAAHVEDLSMNVDLDESNHSSAAVSAGAGGGEASSGEAEQLRAVVTESQKKIEALQAQLVEAQAQAMAAPVGGGAAAAEGGAPAQNTAELDAKIRDLEGRLAEYEIISEDIADLSRFKDENDKLRAELEALRAGGAAPASAPETPAAPVAEEAPAAEPVAAAEPTPEPVAAAEPEPAAPAALDPAVAAAVAEISPPPAVPDEGANLIDDELMKEFAAAVEGQKVLDKVGEKAGDGKAAAEKKTDDTDALMNDFENFVSKKS